MRAVQSVRHIGRVENCSGAEAWRRRVSQLQCDPIMMSFRTFHIQTSCVT